jgi:hypothetical protein
MTDTYVLRVKGETRGHIFYDYLEDTLEEISHSYEDKPMFKSRLGRLNIFSNNKNDDENIYNDVVVDIKD